MRIRARGAQCRDFCNAAYGVGAAAAFALEGKVFGFPDFTPEGDDRNGVAQVMAAAEARLRVAPGG
jgi:hypothetical protein